MAFDKEDSTAWEIIHYITDLFFFIDMVLIFFSAYFDDNLKLVTDKFVIAKSYLLSWFIIDLLAIFPLHLVLTINENTQKEEYNDLVRLSRFGRLYKLFKLARLIRIFKIIKSR